MGGGLLRLAETNDARTHQRPSEECIVEKKEKKKEGRKDRFAIYYEKMKVEARRKDGKRSPVKRPGAPCRLTRLWSSTTRDRVDCR